MASSEVSVKGNSAFVDHNDARKASEGQKGHSTKSGSVKGNPCSIRRELEFRIVRLDGGSNSFLFAFL